MRFARSVFAPLPLSIACALGALFALDRAIAHLELDRAPARGRPAEARRLVRPEFTVDVVTNALGFREPRLPAPKARDTIRIVALGDSFTQGHGVEETAAYPRRLEQLLAARQPERRVEVVNLGVPGTSPRDYLRNLADPGLAYQPDVVLVGVMTDDVQDALVQRRLGVHFSAGVLRDVQRELADERPAWLRLPTRLWPALYPLVWERTHAVWERLQPVSAASAAADPAASRGPRLPPERWHEVLLAFAERHDRRRETEAALEHLEPAFVDALRPLLTGAVAVDSDAASETYVRLLALVQPRLFADAVLLPPVYDEAWEATRSYLADAVRIARRAGARPVIVYIPAAHQVTAAARAPLVARGFEWDQRTLSDTKLADRLTAFGAAEGVAVVDLLPVLRARRTRRLYFPSDGHWTPAGHALAAEAIAGALGRL